MSVSTAAACAGTWNQPLTSEVHSVEPSVCMDRYNFEKPGTPLERRFAVMAVLKGKRARHGGGREDADLSGSSPRLLRKLSRVAI